MNPTLYCWNVQNIWSLPMYCCFSSVKCNKNNIFDPKSRIPLFYVFSLCKLGKYVICCCWIRFYTSQSVVEILYIFNQCTYSWKYKLNKNFSKKHFLWNAIFNFTRHNGQNASMQWIRWRDKQCVVKACFSFAKNRQWLSPLFVSHLGYSPRW